MKNIFFSFNDFILPYIISNVFLIRLNKYILINYECSYLNLSLLNTLLSLFGLVLNSSKLLNYSFKYDAILKLIPTSVCFSLSLIFLNYSLLLNTFGTFLCLQASATIVILVSNVYSTRKFSLKIFFSLVSNFAIKQTKVKFLYINYFNFTQKVSISCGYGLYLFYDINLNYYDLNILAIVSGVIGGFIYGFYLIV